jgi:hypothetical protein
MRIDSSQNVVIGGAAAQTLVSVVPGLQNLATGAKANTVSARYSADATGAGLWMAKSRGASIGSHTVLNSGDTVGIVGWVADNGANLTNFAATIGCVMDGTPSATSLPGRIVFSTTPAATVAQVEVVRFDNAGNVIFADGGSAALTFNAVTPGFQNLGTGASSDAAHARYSADAIGPNLYFGKSRNATLGSHTIVVTGDTLGTLMALADNGTDMHARSGAIVFSVEGTVSSTATPGRISFQTAAASAVVLTECCRIDSAQQQRFLPTPNPAAGSSYAQIRGDDQTGISIATSANAVIGAGHGNLFLVIETTTSNQFALYLASSAFVTLVAQAGTFWVAPTTTPGAGVCSVNWDGTNSYRLYTGSGLGTRTYKVFNIKLGT